ncbi:MAG TPA: peptidase [Terriglobia bacterium]|nr:peptidase [Terriglobia bacterium]
MSNKANDPATEAFNAGLAILAGHPLFGQLESSILRKPRSRAEKNYCPDSGWAIVVDTGEIHVHPTRRAAPEEWAYVIAHCQLHLGLDHFKVRARPSEWNAAACACVTRFLEGIKLGRAPLEMLIQPGSIPARPEETLYQDFCNRGIPEDVKGLSVGGPTVPDLWFAHGAVRPRWIPHRPTNWPERFAEALQDAVTTTIEKAGGVIAEKRKETPGGKARAWFVNHYPLLGALAATFDIVEAPTELSSRHIEIGAVELASQRIFINTKRLNHDETVFVMAHEMLHAALQHDTRCQGRDAFLWNVACDFVINQWLVEMGVGAIPKSGALLDPQLKGLSAESIYDRIVTDLRRYRKHLTFRGVALGDILGDGAWRSARKGIELDEFYRRALQQGLCYHEEQGRGTLPAGLVEEIRALAHPAIPWDVELARWLDNWFQPLERGRTFTRPSRRQSVTPDIPRPSWVVKYPLDSRTFGVILDTSGSMWWKARKNSAGNISLVHVDLLARALGAIASYAMSRDVPAVRLVFCDALPYDQGYLPAEDIAGRVRLRGQGGTVLQPGIQLLENAPDFPRDAPILIITDGECDILKIRREHAFLLPEGRSLPFPPAGNVFRVSA